MPQKIVGQVVSEKGKYFLQVGNTREELPVGVVADQAQLEKLVGQKVQVLYSEPKSFIVGLLDERTYKPVGPLCYVPPAWRVVHIGDEIRNQLGKILVEEGYLSAKVAEMLGVRANQQRG